MKREHLLTGLSLIFAAALVCTGCPQPSNPGGLKPGVKPDNPDKPVINIAKKNVNGEPEFNYVYIEIDRNDPRVAMGYVLDDGKQTPFFDMVHLFNATIRNRDCSKEIPTTSHACTKSGLHLHFNGNIQTLLSSRDKYIKPLQDKGIKVGLGLLEDHDGVGFGILGSWPMESMAPVSGNPAWSGGYPYDEAARTKFLREVADVIEYYNLDGVDFDDEWGSKAPENQLYNYLWPDRVYTGTNEQKDAAREEIGRNIALCAAELRSMVGQDKIITIYDYKAGGWLPETVTFNGETKPIREIINYTGSAFYGSWFNNYSGGESKFPKTQYCPVSMDLGGDSPDTNQRARPSPFGANSITEQMKRHLNGGYGVNMFYNLMNRGRYDGTFTHQTDGAGAISRALFYNDSSSFIPQKNMPETYLSRISQVLFGVDVTYVGPDYPQEWHRWTPE